MIPAKLKVQAFNSIKLLLNPRFLAAFIAVLFGIFAWGALTAAQTSPYLTEPVGSSVQGRPITAYRFGDGPIRIAFIGGIHQGEESVSTDLVNNAIQYYSQHVNAIPRDLTVIFIPNVNPDGYALKQRFNSHGVDLNRNWPTTDWKADTYDVEGLVKGGGGKTPLSEPENIAVWNYIRANNIISVIWYHARGGMVVDSLPTANGQRYATQLARQLAASTGYNYKEVWDSYDISGDASDFLNSKGIYSLTIELNSYTDTDWTQNLRGFSSAISFFTTRFAPETGKSVSGRLLAYWNSNGGDKVMGNPTGDQQVTGSRVWQQFEKGTLTLDQNTGMVAWMPGATSPAEVSVIAQAQPPIPINPIAGPSNSDVSAADQKSADLRDSINKLQQQASDLQKEFSQINDRLGSLPAEGTFPAVNQIIAPPSADLAKAIKVVLGPNSTATVYAYESGKLVRTMGAFSGKPGYETPRGDYKIHYKNSNLVTNKWYENDGTEYILKNYASFTGPGLNYSDDWAFHQMRIPVSGPQAGQMQGGGSHGCLALSPSDAEWIYNWATDGTPVTIY
ncbi:MAG TPA: DUF2817 domain-containing protein [Chloroflexia bacterium]|nr:DUF2817 domain-containing protein [Chloroflexia bacterium]